MYKDFVEDLFSEGVDDQIRQARNIIKQKYKDYTDGQVEEVLRTLMNLTAPYQDKSNPKNKPATNQAHLPKLTKFHVRGGVNIDTLNLYYTRYMNTPSISNKSIERFKDFREFEKEVDANFIANEDAKTEEINEPPIYSDSKINVFLANSMDKCIKYGQGETYGLCISRTNTRTNLYHNYRLDNLTTYFVYFKKETKDVPTGFILIDALDTPDRFSYNKIIPQIDKEISKNDLLQKYPDLKDALDQNIFKSVPIEGEEREYYDKWHNKKITSFTTLDDQLKFVQMGGDIDGDEFAHPNLLDRHLIAKEYLERNGLLPEWILDEYPDIKKRYIQKIDRMLEQKEELFSDWVFLFDVEREYVLNNKTPERFYSQYLKSSDFAKLTAEQQIDRIKIAKIEPSEWERENLLKDRKGAYTAMAEMAFFIPDEIFNEFPDIKQIYDNSIDESINFYIENLLQKNKKRDVSPSEFYDKSSHILRRCVERKNAIYDVLKEEAEEKTQYIRRKTNDSVYIGTITVEENELMPDLSGLTVDELFINSVLINELENLPKKVLGSLKINCPFIKSLKGISEKVNHLNIRNNYIITSLKGLEEVTVSSSLALVHLNKIKSLDYLPQPKLSKNYGIYLHHLKNLESLKGLPNVLNFLHLAGLPKIKNLKGCPFRIENRFNFSDIGPNLESLEGMPGYINNEIDDTGLGSTLMIPSKLNMPDNLRKDVDSAMKKRRDEEELKSESFQFFYYNLLEEKHSIKNLANLNIREISSDMENVEMQNFQSYLQSDADDIEDDRDMKGFTGYGVFDERNVNQGYIYGYYLTDSEFSDYNSIDSSSIVFYDNQFKNFIESKGNESMGRFMKKHFSNNSLYVSNFAVNRRYRISVFSLLSAFVNECRTKNIEYLFFDALPDTIKILKPERLSRNGMRILAEVETSYSKLMVIKI